MNIIGLTHCVVCLGFFIFLIFLYFSKKNANNLDNKVYRYFLLADFILIISEMAFLITAYLIPDNTFVVGFTSRTKYYSILMFFTILTYYVILVSSENNKKFNAFIEKHQIFLTKSVLFILFVVAIFAYALPMTFHYNKVGAIDYTQGPPTNELVTVISVCTILFGTLSVILNWKTIDRKRVSPFFFVVVLELIILAINMYDLSLCFAPFSLTMSCYLMYFTIENPDLKMIAELQLAKNQAEKSNKAKSDFLSSMSHELRTPLNAIVGLSQMIQDSNDLGEIHEDSEDIVTASQNLLELVNGILDINKIEANKVEVIESLYSPTKICDELAKMIKIRIGDKPIELKTEYAPTVPVELYGDKEKIKQILTNLLTNAVKYTEKGSVTLKVESEHEKDKCILIMSVQDTGRGIKEEQKDMLFTKFYRLEEDKDTDIEGTGLGLAITKSLVDMFDGKIIVESKYGEGSKFTVKIPQKYPTEEMKKSVNPPVEPVKVPEEKKEEQHPSEVQQVKEEPPVVEEQPTPVENKVQEQLPPKEEVQVQVSEEVSPTPPVVEEKTQQQTQVAPQSKILLVVDDNKLNLRVASKILKELNYEVDIANSGEECLEKVKNSQYGVIFMDIMMPNMNGVETMQRLKSSSLKTPIIALTADAMEGSREKYLNDGFDEYLSKPIDKDLIDKTIHKFVK